jgi:predicted amidohydrolase
MTKNAHDMAGDTDRFCRASGVTTLCDAGSAGSANFIESERIARDAITPKNYRSRREF